MQPISSNTSSAMSAGRGENKCSTGCVLYELLFFDVITVSRHAELYASPPLYAPAISSIGKSGQQQCIQGRFESIWDIV